MIPNWCKNRLSEADKLKLEESIRQVEMRSSAELVVIIAKSSTRSRHIPYMVLVTLLLLGGHISVVERLEHLWLPPISWIYINVALAFILAWVSRRWSFLLRLLSHSDDMNDEVESRAQLEFYQSAIKKTAQQTGVLIFLSLAERRAVVLADEKINSKVDPQTWNKVLEMLVLGMKQKQMVVGMEKAIHEAGQFLAQHFPIQPGDRDEIPNNLIFKD